MAGSTTNFQVRDEFAIRVLEGPNNRNHYSNGRGHGFMSMPAKYGPSFMLPTMVQKLWQKLIFLDTLVKDNIQGH